MTAYSDMRSVIATRRGHSSRRVALALGAGLLAVTALGFLAIERGGSSAAVRSADASASAQADGTRFAATMKQLLGQVAEAPVRRRPWSKDGVEVLSRVRAGEVWRLGYEDARDHSCWALAAPHVGQEGSCGTHAQIRQQAVLLSGGSRHELRHPSRLTGLVVYGLVSPGVRSLRLRLSDCSVLSLSLAFRPLVWAFVPRGKLARGVLPVAYSAALSDGRTIRRALGPAPACAGR